MTNLTNRYLTQLKLNYCTVMCHCPTGNHLESPRVEFTKLVNSTKSSRHMTFDKKISTQFHQKLSNFENIIYTVNFVRATVAKSAHCQPSILCQKGFYHSVFEKKAHAHIDEIDLFSQFHQPLSAKQKVAGVQKPYF